MYDAIKNFNKQFEYEPVIENSRNFKKYKKFIIAGMGGSNLAGDLLKVRNPQLDVISHKNYGLPELSSKVLKETLVIANSYSGNTEETLDSFKAAIKHKLPVAAISTGGKLLDFARKYKKPYIQMSATGLQPRSALGFNIKAVAKMMGDAKALSKLKSLAVLLKPYEFERFGKSLAKKFKGHVPIIYSSLKNLPIAYNWKIKFNETGKIPAFINYFPELNHNEMTSLDIKDATRELSKNFYFIFLKDMDDYSKIPKRMNITERLYRERGLPVEVVLFSRKNSFYKIFSSLVLADWAAYYTAKEYGLEAEQVPMVEEFKKLIK